MATITEKVVVTEGGSTTLDSEATYTCLPVAGNGGAVEVQTGGTITINGETTFNGNQVTGEGSKGGAIYNAGTVNMANTVTLATETDTVYNTGTLNWNLTGDTTGKLVGYQYLTNSDSGSLTITVKANGEQAAGKYVIATGDFDMDTLTQNLSTEFTVTDGASTTDTITINGTAGIIGMQGYKIALVESDESGADQLVLTVINYTSDHITVDNTSTAEDPYTLKGGKTYTAKLYNGNGGAVEVQTGGNLTGENVTFADNETYGGGEGGAIYNNGGTVTLTGDATFNNNSSGISGGAIDNFGTVTLSNATFANNSTTNDGSGGAIYNDSSCAITINGDATFTNNNCVGEWGSSAGAICNFGTLTFNAGATFTGNTAAYNGAIANYGTLTFNDGATFNGNKTQNNGVIHNACSTVASEDGVINFAGTMDLQTEDDTWVNKGLYWQSKEHSATVNWNLTNVTDAAQSTVLIKGFQRYSNQTTEVSTDQKLLVNQTITVKAEGAQTAGSYVIATGDFTMDTLTQNNSLNFTVTDKTNTTGTITVNGNEDYIDLQGYKIALVESDESGADQLVLTVTNYDEHITVTNASTADNPYELEDDKTYTAKSYTTGNGGAVEVQAGGNLTGEDVTFADNSAKSGGALYNNGTVTIKGDATFNGNTATNKGQYVGGGAFYNNGDTASLTITGDATFSNNTTVLDGGALYNNGGTVSFEGDATFNDNSAPNSLAGAICLCGGTLSFAGDATFSNNTAGAGAGGAIKVNRGTLEFTGTDSTVTFSGNKAVGTTTTIYGGAICNCSNGETMSFAGDVVFSDNTASYSGGAVFGYATVTVKGDATFTGNTVSYSGTVEENKGGGAICNKAGTWSVAGNATFADNSATGINACGGAIWNDKSANPTSVGVVNLGNAVFSNNTAESNGGAIYNGTKGEMSLGNATFTGNTATNGGAIYNNGTVNMANTVTLETATDTWVNQGTSTKGKNTSATVNWDLTGGTEQYGSIKNFQYYSNLKTELTDGTGQKTGDVALLVNQSITVTADQAAGDYTIATGDFDLAKLQENNSTAFTVKTTEDTGKSITVGGDGAVYNGLLYTLAVQDGGEADDTLVLTAKAYDSTTILVNTTWEGKTIGEEVTVGGVTYYYGANAFSSTQAALDGKTDETTTISVDASTDTLANGADLGSITLKLNDSTLAVTDTKTLSNGTVEVSSTEGKQSNLSGKITSAVALKNGVTLGSATNATLSSMTQDGSATLEGAKLTLETGNYAFEIGKDAVLTLSDGADVTCNGDSTGLHFSVKVSGTLTMTGTGTKLTAKYYFANYGTMTISSGAELVSTTDGYGMIHNKSDGVMTVDSATLTASDKIVNYGTMTLKGDNTLTGTENGVVNTDIGTITVESGTTSVTGGTVDNSGTINLKGGTLAATGLTNKGTLNWDLTSGTSTIDWSTLTNETGGKLNITVKADDEKDNSYTLASNASGATGDFTLTGVAGQTDTTISVGGKAAYNTWLYGLEEDGSNNLKLTVLSKAYPKITVTTADKWFKNGDTVTVSGTVTDYIGDGIQSFTVKVGEAEAVAVTLTKQGTTNVYDWSYTYTGDDTASTVLTFTATGSDTDHLTGTETYTLKVDTVAPEIADPTVSGGNAHQTTEGDYWVKKGETATISTTIADTTSDVDTSTVKYDGSNYTSGTAVTITTTDETELTAHTFTAKDIATNESTKSVKIGVDGTGPTIADAVVTGGNVYKVDDGKFWVKKGTTATVSAKVTDDGSSVNAGSGVGSVQFNGDTVAVVEGSTYTKAYDTSTDDHGLTDYALAATDNVGNEATQQTLYIGVDGTGPKITVTHNPATAYVAAVTVSAEFDDGDGSGFKAAQYSFDGATWHDYTGMFAVAENTTVTFKAVDNVGNETTETHTVSNIDDTDPEITFNADTKTLAESVTFSVSAKDDHTAVTLEYSKDDGTTWTACELKSGAGTTSVVSTDLTEDTNGTTWLFRATDAAGNVTVDEVSFNNIYKGTEENFEIVGEKEITSERPIDTDVLEMNGDASLVNNGSVTARELSVTGTDNVISGDVVKADTVTLEEGAELGLDKNQYDSFMANAEFTKDAGRLLVSEVEGNELLTKDVTTLLNKDNVSDVVFKQDLIDVSNLSLDTKKDSVSIGCANVYGTDGYDIISVAANTNVALSAAGDIDLGTFYNLAMVGTNADATFGGTLKNVQQVLVVGGSYVWDAGEKRYELGTTEVKFDDVQTGAANDLVNVGAFASVSAKNLDMGAGVNSVIVGYQSDLAVGGNLDNACQLVFVGGKADDKAKLTAGDVTTTDAYNDYLCVGNYAEATLGSVSTLGGSDYVNIGAYSKLEVTKDVALGEGYDVMLVGYGSDLKVADAAGEAKDITGVENFQFIGGGYVWDAEKKAHVIQNAQLTAGDVTQDYKYGNAFYVGNYADADLGSLTTVEGNDVVNIGAFSDVDVTKGIDLGAGYDTMVVGEQSAVKADSLDFGDGYDILSVGYGATLDVDKLDVASLDCLVMGTDSKMILGEESYGQALARADEDLTWQRYVENGQIVSAA